MKPGLSKMPPPAAGEFPFSLELFAICLILSRLYLAKTLQLSFVTLATPSAQLVAEHTKTWRELLYYQALDDSAGSRMLPVNSPPLPSRAGRREKRLDRFIDPDYTAVAGPVAI